LRFIVGYLNATINRKHKIQNQILKPMGLANPDKTWWLTGMCPGLAHKDAEGGVFGQVWKPTKPFFQSKSRSLAGYLDQLLILVTTTHC
jgi:hypothetical protein